MFTAICHILPSATKNSEKLANAGFPSSQNPCQRWHQGRLTQPTPTKIHRADLAEFVIVPSAPALRSIKALSDANLGLKQRMVSCREAQRLAQAVVQSALADCRPVRVLSEQTPVRLRLSWPDTRPSARCVKQCVTESHRGVQPPNTECWQPSCKGNCSSSSGCPTGG